jgi:hypothetical protein
VMAVRRSVVQRRPAVGVRAAHVLAHRRHDGIAASRGGTRQQVGAAVSGCGASRRATSTRPLEHGVHRARRLVLQRQRAPVGVVQRERTAAAARPPAPACCSAISSTAGLAPDGALVSSVSVLMGSATVSTGSTQTAGAAARMRHPVPCRISRQ